MRPPNLYYTKNGQRQCLKCKQALGRAYRQANQARLKKQRKARLAAQRVEPHSRKVTETVRKKILKRAALGSAVVEGDDV